MAKKIFKEKQRYTNWLAISLLFFLIGGLAFRFISEHWINPVENAMPWTTLAIFIAPLIATLWYVLSVRLSIRMTEKSISLKYSPTQRERQKIKWDDIEEIELVKTPAIAQWSGGNISFNHEKTYSLCGRTGIHIKTKDGQEYLIGTRRFDEFKAALSQVFPSLAVG